MYSLENVRAKPDDNDMVIYEYAPPERYEEQFRSEGDLRQLETNELPSNEMPVELPKNFTYEEYGFTLFNK